MFDIIALYYPPLPHVFPLLAIIFPSLISPPPHPSSNSSLTPVVSQL